ncbi:amino acid adenylation domain-containing protein [Ascidiimonas sp. W6]|uniref:non-ribosomal peptide synthetase family protein n=1 Tax=Ascidiimonas meishanensis TaxID=3128903 RepID=UPI0030EB6172
MTTSKNKELFSAQLDKNSIVKKFEWIVSENYNNTSIHYKERELTYKELNEEVNKLAHYLMDDCHIGQGDIVAIMMPRCENLIISMLAVLKTGAAYLPIDYYSPKTRIDYILSNSNSALLISNEKIETNINNVSWEESENWVQCSTDNINIEIASDSDAYIIYTSGTTGFPKGVCVSNNSLINYVNWLKNSYRIDFRDSTVLFSSHAFDLCYTSLWGSILSGAKLYISDNSKHFDPNYIAKYILDNNISYLKLTPSHLKMLYKSDHFIDNINTNSLRLLILGGEAIDLSDVAFYQEKRRSVKFVNHYGPTETTIGAIAYNINKKNMLNSENIIGKGIANNKVLVLDDNLALVPYGTKGEICIAGLGVSNGYLNNEELTSKLFLPNPYSTEEQDKILYRTGDLGKYREDGNIEFLGRIDNQIKIRGHRIELGEIEYHLNSLQMISNSTVLVSVNQLEEKQLLAYIISSSGILNKDTIVSKLLEVLPEYMIPTHYIQLESFPLTVNGKIDKKALQNPVIEVEENENDFVELNEAQIKLRELWSQLLNLDVSAIRLKSDFFKLGGHSLLIIELIDKIKDLFLVNLSIDDLFEKKTILDLSLHIEAIEKKAFLNIPEIADQIKLLKLSKADESIFFIHDVTGNLQCYFELVKKMDLSCYGIQYKTESFGPQVIEIKQLAQEYIEKIKMIQSSGSYNLVGWSFGGLLSLEIAKQLKEAGDTVNSLVLIDTRLQHEAEKNVGFDLTYEKERIETLLAKKPQWLSEENDINHLWNRFINCQELKEIDIDILLTNIGSDYQHIFEGMKDKDDIIKIVNIMRSLHVSSINYSIEEYKGFKTLYIKASESNEKNSLLDSYFDTLTYTEMEGDHYSIIKNDNAVQLSNLISEFVF